MLVRKAIIPAGGWGTRMLPATKALPKEMLPLVDKPAIQYVVEEAVASGIRDLIMVIRKDFSVIEDHFSSAAELEALLLNRGKHDLLQTVKQISAQANIRFIRQEHPRGLGDAVAAAEELIRDEPFAVLLPDDIIAAPVPCLKQMLDLFDQLQTSLVAVQEVPDEDLPRYGMARPATDDYLCCLVQGFEEKPRHKLSPVNLAIIGRYILSPAIFPLLAKATPGLNGEIQLTDSLNLLAQTENIYACRFSGTRFDVGDKLGFILANLLIGLQRPELRVPLLRCLDNLSGSRQFRESLKTEESPGPAPKAEVPRKRTYPLSQVPNHRSKIRV